MGNNCKKAVNCCALKNTSLASRYSTRRAVCRILHNNEIVFQGCFNTERPPTRTVFISNKIPNYHDYNEAVLQNSFISNEVKSSKFALLYTGDSPVSPWTTLLPLILVITVTGLKQVGDIVRVPINSVIPCDVVLLSSSEATGLCYITTANLDGETNLKEFACLPETRDLQETAGLADFRAAIECQQPITDLYTFEGRIHIHDKQDERITRPLSAQNVLLRGSMLKNTTYVYGAAIYTGQETKISLNSKFQSHKFSRVEKGLNKYILMMLLWLLIQCGLLTGLKHWYYRDRNESARTMWYAPREPPVTFLVVLTEFLAFMVLLNYTIPISLYVTVEMQKFFSSMFFIWDSQMFDAQINEPAKANTSDLNEELGQVEYLFTDKTGTLTENDMKFRQCSAGSCKYEEFEGKLYAFLQESGQEPNIVAEFTSELESLFTAIVLCHTVRVDHKSTENSSTGMEYEYQASSPDEKALLEAARRFGVVYHGFRDDKIEVTFNGELRRFKRHHVLEFDPTRKRMSVIVEDEQGRCNLYVKGADTAVFGRIIEGDPDTVEKHISDFAVLGLRTLVIASRTFSEQEYGTVDALLTKASSAIENRHTELAAAFDEVEKDLSLLGATAVEDRLQDAVPETIEALREAGIHIWVLTGDKEETAVNISQSAGHFTEDMIKLRLCQQRNEEHCLKTMRGFKEILEQEHARGERQHALVVDGKSLAFAMEYYPDEFRILCKKVLTVLCCRVSPLQKAEVVRLVKTSKEEPTTCAIGDGANDVSMIQEAHVGLGIMGKEGRNAVRASDYAFGRFRFVRRALLLHGHYYYVRVAGLVQYFFYKPLFDAFFLTLFNITFSSLPILLYGCLEQNVKSIQLLRHPKTYKRLRKNALLSVPQFIKWCSLGVWHSLVFFFGSYFLIHYSDVIHLDGKVDGNYEFGLIVYTACVLTLMLHTRCWTWIIALGFFISIGGYFVLTSIYNALLLTTLGGPYTLYYSFFRVLSNPSVWLALLLLIVTALIPDVIIGVLEGTYGPFKNISLPAKTQVAGIVEGEPGVSTISHAVPLLPMGWRPSTSNGLTGIPKQNGFQKL